MPTYDEQFFTPPAPLARVTLRNPVAGVTVSEVPMLLDSGADVTLLPQPLLSSLGDIVEPNAGYEVMSFDGRKSVVQVAVLDLIFLKRVFKGRFLIGNQEWGVLGRDVLNHVALLLNGPRLIWDEQRARDE
jgi:hypothetical protein